MLGIVIIEILLVAILIVGIIVILKDRTLDSTQRALWVLAVIFFNFIGLLAFFIWKKA